MMELPKNITQIGESDGHCKIYAEDYVVSYMKQLNQLAQNKDMAVALYGIRREEGTISYLFLYGAAKLTFLQRETRHLSQAQLQEIEKLRKRYFSDYDFQGYRLLNGEMIEGFHVCEQGICRYVQGYAQFYEKNESMLAYMLDTREESEPETVDRQKYEEVRQRQEERRTDYYRGKESGERGRFPQEQVASRTSGEKMQTMPSKSFRRMKMAVVACFALLCLIGLSSLNGKGGLQNLKQVAGRLVEGTMEQKLPDEDSVLTNADTIVAEDKLTEAIQKENQDSAQNNSFTTDVLPSDAPDPDTKVPDSANSDPAMAETTATDPANSGTAMSETTSTPATNVDLAAPDTTGTASTNADITTLETATTATANSDTATTDTTPAAPQSYVIQKGDTLIDISIRQYGSKNKVSSICSLNGIDNPDDIKIGQKILLP